mgnify:CR=1 FL=1
MDPSSQKSSDVLIIGGGIIGICSAYYLLDEGYSVTLLEKDTVNAGSTYGNAGLIIPSDSLPVPGPGVLTQGLRWLLDASSPFYIKPTLNPELLRWLWDFQGACRQSAWERSVPLLTDLSVESLTLFEDILDREGIQCEYHQEGLLLLYREQASFQHGQELLEELGSFEIHGEVLDASQLKARFSPHQPQLQGGIYFQADAHLDPAAFTAQLAKCSVKKGLKLEENCQVLAFDIQGKTITAVHTTRGKYAGDHIVLAAGAWTTPLAAKMGLRVPIQPAKGYSITFPRPEDYPELPLILDEAKIAVTPLGDTLRLAGTLELTGLDLSINQRRVQAILDNAEKYLNVEFNELPVIEIWRGLRPCTADGLPVIGPSKQVTNLITASGHCMLGVSQGTMTGKLVAEIVHGKEPSLALPPLSPDRFS